ncbi:MAG: zinc-dependent metalloprotease [Bacteroidota bacterium]
MKKIILIFLILPAFLNAQQLPSIAEKSKGLAKFEGFLPFYRDDANGKIWLEINQLNTELLYVMSLPAGLGSNDIGLDRGLLGGGRIVKFIRIGKKILMIEPNYGYRAITNAERERAAVEQSFAQSTIWGFTAEAEQNGAVLVDATEFLTRDAMQAANRIRNLKQGNYMLDRGRSALYFSNCKNFPLNTELESTITLINSDGIAGNYVQAVAPSTEAITMRMHHSFVQLPDHNYQPRIFDPRSSFNHVSFYNYSTPVSEPIEKFYTVRHRLQKKNPSAAVSEPVKPIVYYLDNGTPEPIRSALLKGAAWWNQAFEAAGYKGAFIVKVLPDTCDPMDIRYNMINWVHRSTRGWSYGASVVDPRTGEIIKGQVSLGSLRVRQDYMIAQGLLSPFKEGALTEDLMLKMSLDRLEQLSAHEVGHTLGLMHNYAASTVNRSSVMDYPHPLVKIDSKGNIDLSDAYDHQIGVWDKVAITWGYADLRNETDEKNQLNKILSDAYAKGLKFISDRDARAPGGLHPDAHLWDNGNDVLSEYETVMKVRSKALSNFGINTVQKGTPMAFLEDVLVPVYFHHRYQVEAVSKLIGGMHYNYALKGDGQLVTSPLSSDLQQKAMQSLMRSIDPAFLAFPTHIAALIPPRPAGYDFNRELFKKKTGLAFDQLAPSEAATDLVLSFLFHPERINRLYQHGLEGGYGLAEMLNAAINATFKSPRKNGIQAALQMQTEQMMMTYLLSSSVHTAVSYPAKASLVAVLNGLKKFLEVQKKSIANPEFVAHIDVLLMRCKEPEKATPAIYLDAPPGAPIGCEDLF